MPSITFDGQSFLIDGKRTWVVGGTIHSARLTREQWALRIAGAKHAGLNTVTLPLVWARHEPRPGVYDFSGDNDIRGFIQLLAQHGLRCILRVGPFVGEGYDLGGIPPWALGLKDLTSLRAASQVYLEAASRFFGAVAKQVRDLQVTVPQQAGDSVGGPIILVQSEHEWTCGNQAKGGSYLGELNRYIHESGFEVPVINANNLWQGCEGEVDTWVGSEDLLGTMRQLATVRPEQPRLVSKFAAAAHPAWGEPLPAVLDAAGMERRLVEVLAGGGQFNVEPFAGGTNFAFSAGRLTGGLDRWATTAADHGSMLDAAGRKTSLYEPVRVVATFASRFGRILSHLDPRAYAVGLHPSLPARGVGKGKGSRSHAVMHASGSQGSVAFIFAGEGVGDEPATLLLSNGTQLPVYLGGAPAAWCLLQTRLHGRSQLDYCNLSAFALVGRVFVCFGQAGTPARLSINGAPLDVEVPTGAEPLIFEHENIIVVIAAREQLGLIHVGDDVVYVHAVGVSAEGGPVVGDAKDVVIRLHGNGEVVHSKVGDKLPVVLPPPPPPIAEVPVSKGNKPMKAPVGKKGTPELKGVPAVSGPSVRPPVLVAERSKQPKPIELHNWTGTDLSDYLTGQSARYAGINGPSELANVGASYGYGWYRITGHQGASGRMDVAWPHGGDRLHIYTDGKGAGILGRGPGAALTLSVSLKRKDQTLVILAENLGRFGGGSHMIDHKGCVGHAWEVAAARGIGKPVLAQSTKVNVLQHVVFAPGVHDADLTDALRPTWSVSKRKGPLLVRIAAGVFRGLLLVNGAVVKYIDGSGPGDVFIAEESLQRATNSIELAVLGDASGSFKTIVESVELLDCVENLTGKGEWAFAKWERPGDEAFHPLRGHAHGKGPEWFKSVFACSHPGTPLFFATTGLSKGQVYVNGKHIGRYFTATQDGKPVGPQTELLIPPVALKAGDGNELVIFDEHGHLPSKTRLVYRATL